MDKNLLIQRCAEYGTVVDIGVEDKVAAGVTEGEVVLDHLSLTAVIGCLRGGGGGGWMVEEE